jgi:hypothetical protein
MEHNRRQFVSGLVFAGQAVASVRNVRDSGASGRGTALDTKPIQDAIDACSAAGGGTVYVPQGTYLIGTLVLKSHVNLHLETGAVLLGSKKLSDYRTIVPALRSYADNYTDKSLIWGENVEDVSIEGRGVIDGQGASFPRPALPYKLRPYLLRMVNCRGVTVRDVTLKDSAMWVSHYQGCEDVNIEGVAIHSRVHHNNDGIDVDGCRRVRIANCEIFCGDDAIVLKATFERPCRDVVVTNCVISTLCNALKLGTESNGGFENIAISNCSIYDTRLSGITLQMVDGGVLDRVTVSNIVMDGVGAPIFVRLGNRARPYIENGPRPGMGRLRGAIISNVQAVRAGKTGCAISGLPGHAIEDLTLENIRLEFAGGGKHVAGPVPEKPDAYPEYGMFGALPGYGFYCRHVKNLRMRNIETRFASPDERPAMVCEDVEGLDLSGAGLRVGAETASAVELRNVRDALVYGCRVPERVRAFISLAGAASGSITVVGNDLSKAARAVETAGDVPAGAVTLDGKRV